MATGQLYVNKPGSVVVHLTDGSSEHLKYGDPVPSNLASYVDPSTFADGTPRNVNVNAALEAEAHRRAAFAEDGQVNSSQSPVPGNYKELDEDGAAILVGHLASYPEAQAQVVMHEILYCGGRRKIIDAASEAARASAEAQLGDFPEHLKNPTDYTDAEPTPSGFGDPAIVSSDVIIARALAAQGVEPVKASGAGRSVPAPSSETAADVGPGGSNPGGDAGGSTEGGSTPPTPPTSPAPSASAPIDPSTNKEGLEKIAAERGVEVTGTGRNGTVTKADLQQALGVTAE